MRILTVLKHLGPGGIQRAAQNYMQGYRRNGHDVAALCLVREGSRAETLRREAIPIFTGGSSESKRCEAIQQAVRWNANVVHIHRAGNTDAVMTPAVQTLRNSIDSSVPFLETNSFGKVDYSTRHDLVDVHLMKARWALWKWRQWARHYDNEVVGTVIPNAVDTDRFHPVSAEEQNNFKKEYEIPQNAFLFGRVGQPIPCKWSTVIFDAFKTAALHHPEAHLLVVGCPENLGQKIAQLPETVRSRVIEISFLHSDAELRACYSSLDVFLHAADIGESFGTVLAESMACETPVITLSTPAHDNSQLEVVGHRRGGLTVADEENMVRAMNTLMQREDLREKFGRQGAEWVRSNYNTSTIMNRLETVIQLVTTSSSRAQLKKRLQDHPELPTAVSDQEIDHLLKQVMGSPSLTQRILAWLVHIPWLHRLWWKFK